MRRGRLHGSLLRWRRSALQHASIEESRKGADNCTDVQLRLTAERSRHDHILRHPTDVANPASLTTPAAPTSSPADTGRVAELCGKWATLAAHVARELGTFETQCRRRFHPCAA